MTQTTKGVIYLSGPITSNLDGYRKEFAQARQLVEKAGYTPVDSSFLPLDLKESDYMRIAISILEAADTVVALKNWTNSQGAQIEWAYAQRTGDRQAVHDHRPVLRGKPCTRLPGRFGGRQA